MKGANSVSPEACLPRHRMLNSLTWYLIFDVQTVCSLSCKCVEPDFPSFLLGVVFSGLLRCCLPGWSPKHSHQVKQVSTFRLGLRVLVNKLNGVKKKNLKWISFYSNIINILKLLLNALCALFQNKVWTHRKLQNST